MTGMTSPHFLRLAKLASVVVALLALSGCNDCTPDKPCCNAGEICGCEDGTNSCLLECGSGCDLECATGNGCEQVCGDDCEIECKDMPTCDGSCGANPWKALPPTQEQPQQLQPQLLLAQQQWAQKQHEWDV